MIKIQYKLNNEILEHEVETTEDATKFMAEHDIVKFECDKVVKESTIVMPSFGNLIDESVLDVYAKDAINEVKQYDQPHGKKLSNSILTKFFADTAPKMNSLQAVEAALKGLYKQNGVEFTPKVISQIISSYKKKAKLSEAELLEVTLSSKEKQMKDKLVISLKKNLKQNRQRYKDKETADLNTLATALVKD
jgi:hypothetical protein